MEKYFILSSDSKEGLDDNPIRECPLKHKVPNLTNRKPESLFFFLLALSPSSRPPFPPLPPPFSAPKSPGANYHRRAGGSFNGPGTWNTFHTTPVYGWGILLSNDPWERVIPGQVEPGYRQTGAELSMGSKHGSSAPLRFCLSSCLEPSRMV